MRRLTILAFALVLAAAGCAEADPETAPEETSPPPATTAAPAATTSPPTTAAEAHDDGMRIVDVVMTDFAFEPGSFDAHAGETVMFRIENAGSIEHEFRLSNTHRIEEHLASGHEDHAEGGEEEGAHHEDADFVVLVAAGETVDAEFTFPMDGSLYTEVACLIPGHYEAGMKAGLTVEGGTEGEHTEGEEHSDEEEQEEHSEGDDHGEEGTEASGDGTVVEVVMTDFAFEPSSFEFAAGETVTFVIANEGVIEHEFRLSNSHRIEEHLASGHEDHGDDEEGHHEDGDFVVLVAPGDTVEADFTFPDDTTLYTEVACLIEGHYEAGMLADLTVNA